VIPTLTGRTACILAEHYTEFEQDERDMILKIISNFLETYCSQNVRFILVNNNSIRSVFPTRSVSLCKRILMTDIMIMMTGDDNNNTKSNIFIDSHSEISSHVRDSSRKETKQAQ
jgi:hypothetical protein